MAKITAAGWEVVPADTVPVRFIHRRGMQPLPKPVSGGSIDELRAFVNLPSRDAWTLFVAYLTGALRPRGPYPIAVITGEQGSTKSTLCKIARDLIDPNIAPLRRPPRDERDICIAACNGWLVALDNVSGVKDWQSDALCTLATGGGFAIRELYSDDEEKLFEAMRPIIINGIDDIGSRADFVDRCLRFDLPTISDSDRRPEADLWREFYEARPSILGALCDATSTALGKLPTVHFDHLPRMADLAAWVSAAGPAFGWERGRFIRAYEDNRAGANLVAIEASAVGPAIVKMIGARGRWEGIASELLAEISTYADEADRNRKDWPSKPQGMASALRRIAPNLRASGLAVRLPDKSTGKEKRRLIQLEKMGETLSASAASAAVPLGRPESPGGGGALGDKGGASTTNDAPGEAPVCGSESGAAGWRAVLRVAPFHRWRPRNHARHCIPAV